jgi:hypothetical protein
LQAPRFESGTVPIDDAVTAQPPRQGGITVAPLTQPYIFPRTGIQSAAAVPQWTWWRIGAVTLAVLLAAVAVSDAVAALVGVDFTLITALRHLADPDAPPLSRGIDRQLPKIVVDLVVSAVIVGLLWIVAGPRAVGLHRRLPGESVLAIGAAMRGPYLAALIGATSALLAGGISHEGAASGSRAPVWFMVLFLTNAGIVEEITLTVLPYWLLEQVRTRSGTPVAHTGLGMALIVGVWWVLHLPSAGFPSVGLLALFFLKLLLWRHSKHLPVLLALHIGWNLWLYLTTGVLPSEFALPICCGAFVAVGLVTLWESRVAPANVPVTHDAHHNER